LLFPEISISVDSPPTTSHKFADISAAPESALPFLLRRVSSLCASGPRDGEGAREQRVERGGGVTSQDKWISSRFLVRRARDVRIPS